MITNQHNLSGSRARDRHERFRFHAHATFIHNALLYVITGEYYPWTPSCYACAKNNLYTRPFECPALCLCDQLHEINCLRVSNNTKVIYMRECLFFDFFGYKMEKVFPSTLRPRFRSVIISNLHRREITKLTLRALVLRQMEALCHSLWRRANAGNVSFVM